MFVFFCVNIDYLCIDSLSKLRYLIHCIPVAAIRIRRPSGWSVFLSFQFYSSLLEVNGILLYYYFSKYLVPLYMFLTQRLKTWYYTAKVLFYLYFYSRILEVKVTDFIRYLLLLLLTFFLQHIIETIGLVGNIFNAVGRRYSIIQPRSSRGYLAVRGSNYQ